MPEIQIEDDLTRAKRGITWMRLEEALHGAGCPICSQIDRTEKHYLEGLLYEYVLDAGVRMKLHRQHGFCTRHAKLAIEAEKELDSDGLHLATMFETVIEENRRLLESQSKQLEIMAKEAKKRRKKISLHSVDASKCFVCDFVKESEGIATHGFLYFANDKELIDIYEKSETLVCFRHLQMLVKEKVSAQIVAATLKKVNKINRNLSNFIRKHDYQSPHDYTQDELHSYRTAVNYIAGDYRW